MPTFRLTLEYDGTEFAGWQVQARGERTVQGTLEDALSKITGENPRVEGAGRTDSGVHAEGQVASVEVATRLGAGEVARALNAVLPRDLKILALEVVPEGFRARRDARSKLYRYGVWNGPVPSPLRIRTFHAVPSRLDLGAMGAACRPLLGTHDFAAFQAAGSSARTTERTLLRLEVEGAPGGEIFFFAEGSGFLRHMVRNLVGTLLEVGLGRRPPEWVRAVLQSRDRAEAGPTAPALGLTLVRVAY